VDDWTHWRTLLPARLAESQWLVECEVGTESSPFRHLWLPFYRPGVWAFDPAAGAGLEVSFLDPRDFEYWATGGTGQSVVLELRQPLPLLLQPASQSESKPCGEIWPSTELALLDNPATSA
jgi:hypothetical protein